MTFLNPLLLFGLAAAAIPLILHLLNLRKLRTIEFSTLSFLKELQRTSIRRLKLRQILLLIVRTALIVFIVLAFARPALRGSMLGTIGSHAHTSVVIIFDDSFSMAVSDDRGERYRQAKAAANQILELLKDADEVAVLRLSDLPKLTMEEPTRDRESVRRIIAESALTFGSGSMDEAIRLAAKVLDKSKNANKEVYFVSDLQRTLFQMKESPAEQLFVPQTRIFAIDIGSDGIRNAAIDSVSVHSRIIEAGRPLSIWARVRNFGDVPLRDHVVSLYFDGTRVAQRNVDVPAWGSAAVELTAPPRRAGFIGGRVAIEEDALEQDNRRWFTLSVPERIRVLMVAPSQADVRYLSLVLGATSTDSAAALFNIRLVAPQQFGSVELSGIDVVLCANVPSFSTGDVERLKSFVDQGGGLILIPGDATNIENYNATILTALSISRFEGIIRKTDDTQSPLTLSSIDFDHPVFSEVYESGGRRQRTQPDGVNVFTAIRRQVGKEGRMIISLSDQTPFLSEHAHGSGIVLIFSSALVSSWTDLPVRGMFAPLVHRAMMYSAVRGHDKHDLRVGDVPTIKIPFRDRRSSADAEYTVRSSDGTDEIIPANFITTPVGASLVVANIRFLLPGIHEVRNKERVLSTFAVNVDPSESDLRKIDGFDLVTVLASYGIEEKQILITPSGVEVHASILQSRFGVELWKLCLIAALIFALIEMVLARDGGKKQALQSEIASTRTT